MRDDTQKRSGPFDTPLRDVSLAVDPGVVTTLAGKHEEDQG